MFTMREGERDHSCAALAVYRQEVLHGQDVSDGCQPMPLLLLPPASVVLPTC